MNHLELVISERLVPVEGIDRDIHLPNPIVAVDEAMRAAAAMRIELKDEHGAGACGERVQCVNCSLPDAGEAKRVFDALSDGGQVQMPLGQTFFSPAFGMCTDRFGTPWMIMVDAPTQPAQPTPDPGNTPSQEQQDYLQEQQRQNTIERNQQQGSNDRVTPDGGGNTYPKPW